MGVCLFISEAPHPTGQDLANWMCLCLKVPFLWVFQGPPPGQPTHFGRHPARRPGTRAEGQRRGGVPGASARALSSLRSAGVPLPRQPLPGGFRDVPHPEGLPPIRRIRRDAETPIRSRSRLTEIVAGVFWLVQKAGSQEVKCKQLGEAPSSIEKEPWVNLCEPPERAPVSLELPGDIGQLDPPQQNRAPI